MDDQFSSLPTEAENPLTRELSRVSTRQALELINDEDAKVAAAVRVVLDDVVAAVNACSLRMAEGGRLFYVGAGTSGRLGILDASECPPTFGTEPEMVQGLIAGGRDAVFMAQEGAEDDLNAGAVALDNKNLTSQDTVVGLAASGRTPYVVGALQYAQQRQALTVGLTVNPEAAIKPWCDILIAPVVGPEVIAGSTRMKAGTAQKLILNMISTGVMLRIGRIEGNRMTNLRPTCAKLEARARQLVMMGAGVDAAQATQALGMCNGNPNLAIRHLKERCKRIPK